jgi:hypothetical protein
MRLLYLPTTISILGLAYLGLIDTASAQNTLVLNEQGQLESTDSRLNDNSPFDAYSFDGITNQQITITLESQDFDTYLMLLDSDNNIIAQNDDAEDGSTNSSLVVTLPVNGRYTTIANSYNSSGRGTYSLSIYANNVQGSSVVNSQNNNTDSHSLSHAEDYIGQRFSAVYPGSPVDLPGNPLYIGSHFIAQVPLRGEDVDKVKSFSWLLHDTDLVLLITDDSAISNNGASIIEIIDAVRVPADNIRLEPVQSGQYVVAAGSCLISGTPDPEILAIVRQTNDEYFTDIRQAWRANRETLRFENISIADITCQNSQYLY